MDIKPKYFLGFLDVFKGKLGKLEQKIKNTKKKEDKKMFLKERRQLKNIIKKLEKFKTEKPEPIITSNDWSI